MVFRTSSVVKIVEFDPIPLADQKAEELKFRVEVLQRDNADHYYARVYRRETFRIQPTFPQAKGVPAGDQGDHEFYIIDDYFSFLDFEGQTPDEVLKKVEAVFNDRYHAQSTKK